MLGRMNHALLRTGNECRCTIFCANRQEQFHEPKQQKENRLIRSTLSLFFPLYSENTTFESKPQFARTDYADLSSPKLPLNGGDAVATRAEELGPSLAMASPMASTHSFSNCGLGAKRSSECPLFDINGVMSSKLLFCLLVFFTTVSLVNDTIWKISASGDFAKRNDSAAMDNQTKQC